DRFRFGHVGLGRLGRISPGRRGRHGAGRVVVLAGRGAATPHPEHQNAGQRGKERLSVLHGHPSRWSATDARSAAGSSWGTQLLISSVEKWRKLNKKRGCAGRTGSYGQPAHLGLQHLFTHLANAFHAVMKRFLDGAHIMDSRLELMDAVVELGS